MHDDHRWLENLDDPEVAAFARAQSASTRLRLEASPSWPAILAGLRRVCAQPTHRAPTEVAGRRYLLVLGDGDQAVLHRDGPRGPVCFDPGVHDPSGRTAIAWFAPSPDGRVALGLAVDGREAAALHVLEADGSLGPPLSTELLHASVGWLDGGLLLARHPPPGPDAGAPDVVALDLRTGVQTSLLTGQAGERFGVQAEGDEAIVVATVFPAATLYRLTGADFTPEGFTHDGLEVLDRFEGWAPCVLHAGGVHLSDARGHRVWEGEWAEVDPRPASALQLTAAGALRMVAGRLVLGDDTLALPENTSARLPSGATMAGQLLITSFFSPSTLFSVEDGALVAQAPFDVGGFAVRRDRYTSDRGLPIDVFLLGEAGGPVLLTAYGAGGMPYRPSFLPHAEAWIRLGGQVCVASIRSAATQADRWPHAGRFEAIQHAYDEVVAAARWLRAGGAPRVAAFGASHGGLVMAGALMTAPEAFDAVCCHVPLVDMFRHATLANGWFTHHYGDPAVPGHADWLARTSPYQQVRARSYPPVLLTAAWNDLRTHPAHAMKLAAALQAVSAPAELIVDMDAGHGAGTRRSARVRGAAEQVAFLWEAVQAVPESVQTP